MLNLHSILLQNEPGSSTNIGAEFEKLGKQVICYLKKMKATQQQFASLLIRKIIFKGVLGVLKAETCILNCTALEKTTKNSMAYWYLCNNLNLHDNLGSSKRGKITGLNERFTSVGSINKDMSKKNKFTIAESKKGEFKIVESTGDPGKERKRKFKAIITSGGTVGSTNPDVQIPVSPGVLGYALAHHDYAKSVCIESAAKNTSDVDKAREVSDTILSNDTNLRYTSGVPEQIIQSGHLIQSGQIIQSAQITPDEQMDLNNESTFVLCSPNTFDGIHSSLSVNNNFSFEINSRGILGGQFPSRELIQRDILRDEENVLQTNNIKVEVEEPVVKMECMPEEIFFKEENNFYC